MQPKWLCTSAVRTSCNLCPPNRDRPGWCQVMLHHSNTASESKPTLHWRCLSCFRWSQSSFSFDSVNNFAWTRNVQKCVSGIFTSFTVNSFDATKYVATGIVLDFNFTDIPTWGTSQLWLFAFIPVYPVGVLQNLSACSDKANVASWSNPGI